MEKMRKLFPDDVKVLNNMNVAIAKDPKNAEKAEKNFKNIEKIDPQNVLAKYNQGIYYYKKVDFLLLQLIFRKITKKPPATSSKPSK